MVMMVQNHFGPIKYIVKTIVAFMIDLLNFNSIKRFYLSQSKPTDSFKNLSCKLCMYYVCILYIVLRLYKVICICPHCKCVRSENYLLVEETPLLRVNWLVVSAYNVDAGYEWIQMQDCNKYNGEGPLKAVHRFCKSFFFFLKLVRTYQFILCIYILFSSLALCCLNWYYIRERT